MDPYDPIHGAIREAKPRYPSGHDSAATHLAMLILVWFLRVVAVLLAGWAALCSYFAMWFRMEGSSELEMIKEADVELGGAFALAVVLFFVPGSLKKPIQCLLILGIAALIWFCVSGYLISCHEWQYRFRSGL